MILSELEDFEQKRHDHEHRGDMSLKYHSGSCVQIEMNWKTLQKSKDEVLIAQTGWTLWRTWKVIQIIDNVVKSNDKKCCYVVRWIRQKQFQGGSQGFQPEQLEEWNYHL